MIKDFLILNCIGKNNKIGICIGRKFYVHELDNKINKNDQLVLNILNLVKKYKVNLDNKFSIIVNIGPGSFSSIRASISVAKGIKISKGTIVGANSFVNKSFPPNSKIAGNPAKLI